MDHRYLYDSFLLNFDKNLYIEHIFTLWCLKDKPTGRIESLEGQSHISRFCLKTWFFFFFFLNCSV